MKYSLDLVLFLSTLTAASAADIKSSLDSVSSQASSLKQMVDSWTADSGLTGALSIQEKFPDLQSAVQSLATAAGSASDSDVDADSAKATVSQVTDLLDSLNKKAGDFKSAGVDTIVAKDISSLTQPAQNVVSGLGKAISSDCSKVDTVNSVLKGFSSGFSQAGSSFGIDGGNIPSQLTCDKSSAPSSGSSSGSSSAASSAVSSADSSAATSAPPALAVSPDSAPAMASMAPGLAAFNSSSPTNGTMYQPPSLANGAGAMKPAVAGLSLVAAALLL